MTSFRSVLAGKDLALGQGRPSVPGTESVGADFPTAKGRDGGEAKSTSGKSSAAGRLIEVHPAHARLSGKTTPPGDDSMPFAIMVPSVLDQSVSPVSTHVDRAMPHVDAQFAGSPTPRSEWSPAGTGESKVGIIHYQAANASVMKAAPGDKGVVKLADTGTRKDSRGSLNTDDGGPRDDAKSSPNILPDTNSNQFRGNSLHIASSQLDAENKASASGAHLKETTGRSEGSVPKRNADSEIERTSVHELILRSPTGVEEGTPASAQPSRPKDRSAKNAPSRQSNPAETVSSQRPVSPRLFVPAAASSGAKKSKQTPVIQQAASNLESARLSTAGRTPSHNEQATPAHQASNQPLDLNLPLHTFAPGRHAGPSIGKEVSGAQAFIHAVPVTPSDVNPSKTIPFKLGAQETFAALDGEQRAATPIWVHTGGMKAEAGFKDPALGWVGVRAQAGESGVHAALVPGSADANRALTVNLPSIHEYLEERHTPVQTLTILSPESSWDGKNHSGGMEAGQGNGQQDQSGRHTERTDEEVIPAPETRITFGLAPDSTGLSPSLEVAGGMHISVIA